MNIVARGGTCETFCQIAEEAILNCWSIITKLIY